jgi:D-alanine-D-alanine ligase
MKVGLTYDLRDEYRAEGYSEDAVAEFDRADTIEHLEGALRELGYLTDRIGHVRSLARRLVAGDRWDIVFNIAEGLAGFGREAQVPALLDAWGIPYTFSDPLVLCLTLHKGMTKRVIRDLGIPTPDFAVIERVGDLEALDLPFPLFAKPVAEGTSKGVGATSKIGTAGELPGVVAALLERFRQPVLLETFLPGREFTVGIVGTGDEARAVGVLEVHLNPGAEAEVYSYLNKERCEELVTYRLADDALADRSRDVALAAWRGLGCRDAGRVDVRADAAGHPSFIEVNPLAGIHPEHSDLPIMAGLAGLPFVDLIGLIMGSALDRLGIEPPSRRGRP